MARYIGHQRKRQTRNFVTTKQSTQDSSHKSSVPSVNSYCQSSDRQKLIERMIVLSSHCSILQYEAGVVGLSQALIQRSCCFLLIHEKPSAPYKEAAWLIVFFDLVLGGFAAEGSMRHCMRRMQHLCNTESFLLLFSVDFTTKSWHLNGLEPLKGNII